MWKFLFPSMAPKNMSEADFAKWNQERAKDKARIKQLEDDLADVKGELRMWRNEAMRHISR
jgi:hypothetical protein